jgi:hypothetical protein
VTIHVISVGISLLDVLAAPYGKLTDRDVLTAVCKAEPHNLLAQAGIGEHDRDKASSWLAAALAPSGDPFHDTKKAAKLAAVATAAAPQLWPNDLCAEIGTFARVLESKALPPGDTAVLICSDTPDGLLAGVWNAAALTHGDLSRVRYIASPGSRLGLVRGKALVVRIFGMDAGNESGFQQAMSGLGTFGHNLVHAEGVPDDVPFRFYLSGGYKAAIPYLIGLAEGVASRHGAGQVEAFVLHKSARDTDKPVRLPLRRMGADRVSKELALLTGQPAKVRLPSDYLKGYAWEETPEGYKLTAFGAGLKALFGIRSPGLGT